MRVTRTAHDKVRLDDKHHLEVNQQGSPIIVKTGNGIALPDDEPRILFRGRDKLAVKMLEYYRVLCIEEGCNDFQLASMDKMITEFSMFAATSETIKQPGITRGK